MKTLVKRLQNRIELESSSKKAWQGRRTEERCCCEYNVGLQYTSTARQYRLLVVEPWLRMAGQARR